MKSEDGPATLATVAASAGVSVATVSKVLNGRSDVGPGTRARVQSLLQEHDYVERRSPAPRPGTGAPPTLELAFHGLPRVNIVALADPDETGRQRVQARSGAGDRREQHRHAEGQA